KTLRQALADRNVFAMSLESRKSRMMSSFRWRQTGRSVPASADPFDIDRQTARDVKDVVWMHSP
ncbi:hypothetical protein AB9F41_37750, partial [Rhizobium leguminosarum]|uniref:hypothetical protein n=1 Tax=Rhizobium leguminosarum TaxID=384 RepID=UPI003F991227